MLVYVFIIASLWDDALAVEFPALSTGFSLTRLIGVLLACQWIFLIAAGKKDLPKFSHVMKAAFAFILFAGLTAFWSNEPARTIDRFITLLQLFLLFIIVPVLIDSPKKLRRLSISICLAASTMALVVIWRWTNNIGFLDEQLLLRSTANEAIDPNIASATMALGFSLSLGLALTAGTFKRKVPYYVFTILSALGIVATLSRTFILGLIFVAPWAVLIRVHGGKLRKAFTLLMVIIGIIAVLEMVGISESVTSRISTVYNPVVANPRSSIWRVGLTAFYTSPLIGVGMGSFDRSFLHYQYLTKGTLSRTMTGRSDVHNIYLQVLAEMGVVGFLLFMIFFVFVIRDLRFAWVRIKTYESNYGVVIGLAFSGIIMAFGAFFVPILFRKVFWLVPLLVEVVLHQANVHDSRASIKVQRNLPLADSRELTLHRGRK